jgi:peptidylprolyl isomerase domain and WD repeat-containing protein 1
MSGEVEGIEGPQLPAAKKRKKLEFEEQYLRSLPLSDMYERSYMHRDVVTQVAASPQRGFIITASMDGVVKFWKKTDKEIEFAKEYKAHTAPISQLSVSDDGSLVASISMDKTMKIFDVGTFDMIAILKLQFKPVCVEWVFRRGLSDPLVAVADSESPQVSLFDIQAEAHNPIKIGNFHASPITVMRYNSLYDIVISADAKGIYLFCLAESNSQCHSLLITSCVGNQIKQKISSSMV